MTGYYEDKLAAERLLRCYEIATPRVRQYLEAEIEHVRQRVERAEPVLELGCGYGRVLGQLSVGRGLVIGIDTSLSSLRMGRDFLRGCQNVHLVAMNAVALGFPDATMGAVVCIQNGISAFHVDRRAMLREALRVTRPGGQVLFSSYAAAFWDDRLAWFELQAACGLLGEIDYERTREGTIVCKDGFTATTVGPGEFAALASEWNVPARIEQVDNSSVFCELRRM